MMEWKDLVINGIHYQIIIKKIYLYKHLKVCLLHLIKNGKAIGIDLGTTFSCVAVWEGERFEVISNDMGNRTTPSMVAFTDSERMVGDSARNQISSNPLNTIFDAKRLIGRKFDDPNVQSDMKHFPFKVTKDKNGNPILNAKYGEDKTLLQKKSLQ